MFIIIINFLNSWKLLSWNKSYLNVFRLQKRIFKALLVGDLKMCLSLQKLLLSSNSLRLLAVRSVTLENFSKLNENKSLNFVDKYNLSIYLLNNVYNWKPQKLKKFFFLKKDGSSSFTNSFSLFDRAWQFLIKIILEPVCEASISPRNFSFRGFKSIYFLQRSLFLNLNKKSFGMQKRVLVVFVSTPIKSFDINLFLKKILVPRSIKIGIFRFFKMGLFPSFSDFLLQDSDLSGLIANILFNGMDLNLQFLQFGFNFLFFLNPKDNELRCLNSFDKFFRSIGINSFQKSVRICSSLEGFDFLDWHFRVYPDGKLFCSPSVNNYRFFLKRVKAIINNSNFGANVKCLKLFPIIREWKYYHQFCNLRDFRISLFQLKKKAFKIFNKESKQDSYSTRRLLNKSFSLNSSFNHLKVNSEFSLYGIHISFCIDFNKRVKYNLYSNTFKFCIHCGMNIVL
uniref:Ycf13 n=1 Tax=Phacus pleuronectes TaxID=102908 RepID=A0A3G3LLT4_9EUGL|nr:ycf13 [Phacus pleuronectes]AYQ93669.1 ycf13 [Phacus pleuronectes]